MKKIQLLAVVCCTLMVAQAQRVYFIYLQSDNKSPFYLKTGDKVFSSTAQGYLIVPKLVDSTYNVVIGKQGFNEGRFTVPINGNDRGFLLRESGSKISLFDLQTMAVIEAVTSNSGEVPYIQKNDRFTTLLSQAADDTTLLQMAVFAKAEKAPEPAPAVAKVTAPVTEATNTNNAIAEKDTQSTTMHTAAEQVIVDTTAVAKTEKPIVAEKEPIKQQQEEVVKTEAVVEEPLTAAANEPVAEESVFKRSVVTRRAESSTSEGFGLVFTDSADGVVDTIRLVIPNPKIAFQIGSEEAVVKDESRFIELKETESVAEPEKEVKHTKKETIQEEVAPIKKKKLSLFGKKEEGTEEKAATAQQPEAVKADGTCRSNASNSDFAKLRRNMVNKATEDDMIAEAKKAFNNNCFTTLQLKTLSSLLLTSAGRYSFFEAAYNHVSDKENFRSLQNELWDRADINRFKALLAN